MYLDFLGIHMKIKGKKWYERYYSKPLLNH